MSGTAWHVLSSQTGPNSPCWGSYTRVSIIDSQKGSSAPDSQPHLTLPATKAEVNTLPTTGLKSSGDNAKADYGG